MDPRHHRIGIGLRPLEVVCADVVLHAAGIGDVKYRIAVRQGGKGDSRGIDRCRIRMAEVDLVVRIVKDHQTAIFVKTFDPIAIGSCGDAGDAQGDRRVIGAARVEVIQADRAPVSVVGIPVALEIEQVFAIQATVLDQCAIAVGNKRVLSVQHLAVDVASLFRRTGVGEKPLFVLVVHSTADYSENLLVILVRGILGGDDLDQDRAVAGCQQHREKRRIKEMFDLHKCFAPYRFLYETERVIGTRPSTPSFSWSPEL